MTSVEPRAFMPQPIAGELRRCHSTAVDASPSGRFTSRLVGLLAGVRQIPTTVIHFDYETAGSLGQASRQGERTEAVVNEGCQKQAMLRSSRAKG